MINTFFVLPFASKTLMSLPTERYCASVSAERTKPPLPATLSKLFSVPLSVSAPEMVCEPLTLRAMPPVSAVNVVIVLLPESVVLPVNIAFVIVLLPDTSFTPLKIAL